MNIITDGLKEAFRIILACDSDFLQVVLVSLKTAGLSTLIATVAGVPTGIIIARRRFKGRSLAISSFQTLMSMPTVVIGLLVYAFLSRQGPLGELGLLYSISAMVIGQSILAFPIVVSLSISAAIHMDDRIDRTLMSLGANSRQSLLMFIREARFGLMAAVMAGFGRVFSEIGISMMLGGNIKAYTRNITTTIALETNRGEFALGFALGIVLLTAAFTINAAMMYLQRKSK